MPDQPQQHGVGGVEFTGPMAVPTTHEELAAAFRHRCSAGHALSPESTEWLRAEITDLRARCASLEAVVEAARPIAGLDWVLSSPYYREDKLARLRRAVVALDQHATEAAPHEVIHAISTPLTVMIATVQMGVRHGEIPKEIGESLLTEIKRVREIIGWPKSESENENKGR